VINPVARKIVKGASKIAKGATKIAKVASKFANPRKVLFILLPLKAQLILLFFFKAAAYSVNGVDVPTQDQLRDFDKSPKLAELMYWERSGAWMDRAADYSVPY
jgi:hypothetical protein